MTTLADLYMARLRELSPEFWDLDAALISRDAAMWRALTGKPTDLARHVAAWTR